MIGPVEMGALLKKIRLSKNLTLKELASDYLSVSFLSKFERGESDISLSRFFLLLDKLDVSIEEFYGILSQDNPTHTEKLLESASKAYYQNDSLSYRSTLEKSVVNLRLHKTNHFSITVLC